MVVEAAAVGAPPGGGVGTPARERERCAYGWGFHFARDVERKRANALIRVAALGVGRIIKL